MSDAAWELFDSLVKTIQIQSGRMAELEERVKKLEEAQEPRAVYNVVDIAQRRDAAEQGQ